MNRRKQLTNIFCVVISMALIIQLSACGFFMYPERRGQSPGGRIDPAIATLDALGLLLFIFPGVIAFAVDITNGTLYFPSERHRSSSSNETKQITVIRVNPGELNERTIREIVQRHTGVSIGSDLRDSEIYKVDRSENIEAKLVELEKSGYKID